MNNKAASEVIGVILMIAITIAIAATVYVYVSAKMSESNIEHRSVSGNVTKIVTIYSNVDIDYNITFDYNNSFYINDDPFEWKLGEYYSLELYRYYDEWHIDSIIITTEELESDVQEVKNEYRNDTMVYIWNDNNFLDFPNTKSLSYDVC